MSQFLLALLLLASAPPCAFSALRTQSSREKAAADDELEVRDEEEELEQKNAPAEAKPAERGSDAFAQLDRNQDGFHDEHEIALHIQHTELRNVLDEIDRLDTDGDGTISIGEYQQQFLKGVEIRQYQARLKKGQPTVNTVRTALLSAAACPPLTGHPFA